MAVRKSNQSAAAVAPLTPAMDLEAMIAKAVAANLAALQAAPAKTAKAVEAPKAKAEVTDLTGVTLRATGALRPSSTGKTMLLPVSGSLPNGTKLGGTLWIKV